MRYFFVLDALYIIQKNISQNLLLYHWKRHNPCFSVLVFTYHLSIYLTDTDISKFKSRKCWTLFSDRGFHILDVPWRINLSGNKKQHTEHSMHIIIYMQAWGWLVFKTSNPFHKNSICLFLLFFLASCVNLAASLHVEFQGGAWPLGQIMLLCNLFLVLRPICQSKPWWLSYGYKMEIDDIITGTVTFIISIHSSNEAIILRHWSGCMCLLVYLNPVHSIQLYLYRNNQLNSSWKVQWHYCTIITMLFLGE